MKLVKLINEALKELERHRDGTFSRSVKMCLKAALIDAADVEEYDKDEPQFAPPPVDETRGIIEEKPKVAKKVTKKKAKKKATPPGLYGDYDGEE